MTDLRTALQVCQEIYDREGGLTPALLVEEARPKDHPLHKNIFDRPQKAAAEAWYLHRAEAIIQKLVVSRKLSDGQPVNLRAFSPVRVDQPTVYDPLDVIVENDVFTAVYLRQMEREWKSIKARYEGFKEFWAMVRKDSAA